MEGRKSARAQDPPCVDCGGVKEGLVVWGDARGLRGKVEKRGRGTAEV